MKKINPPTYKSTEMQNKVNVTLEILSDITRTQEAVDRLGRRGNRILIL